MGKRNTNPGPNLPTSGAPPNPFPDPPAPVPAVEKPTELERIKRSYSSGMHKYEPLPMRQHNEVLC